MNRRSLAGILLISLLAGGCTYVCHDYDFIEPSVDEGRWSVSGRLYRYMPEDYGDPPGSWSHWKAEEDDRYRLVLTPVAADTTFWLSGDVEIRDAKVFAVGDTVPVPWREKIDLVEKYRDWVSPTGERRPQQLEWGKMSFESDYFFIPFPVPDTLWIEFELDLLDLESGEVIDELRIKTPAVIDRHRRWSIVDAIES